MTFREALLRLRLKFWKWLYEHGPNWYWIFSRAWDATTDLYDATGPWGMMWEA